MKLSDGALLTVLTGIAYSTAFAYEVGACLAFGIPLDLIDLQLLPSLFRTLAALSVLAILLQVADPLFSILRSRADEHPVKKALRVPVAIILLNLTIVLIGGSAVRPVWVWIVPGLLLLASLAPLVFALLYRGRPYGYVDTLRVTQQADAQRQGPLNSVLFGSYAWMTHLSVLSTVLIVLSLAAGYGQAERQRNFFVTNQQPEAVVLRIYGERVITAEFVRAEKRLKRLYQVLKIDAAGLVLRQETVGPLSLDAVGKAGGASPP